MEDKQRRLKRLEYGNYEIWRVRYFDHHKTGWVKLEVFEEDLKDGWIEAVGWVVRETDEWLILMMEWSGIQEEGSFCAIRKADIFEQEVLVKKGVAEKA